MQQKELLTYDLHSYSQALQEAVLEGYRVVNQTIGFPQVVGNVFMATVVKDEKDVIKQATNVVEEPAKKPVRKQKEN